MARDDIAGSDQFDSREVIDRIEELITQDTRDEDEQEELDILQAFAAEAEGYAADWHYGAQFIRDDKFEDYARELAEDIGAINTDGGWPNTYIDWPAAAEALQMDYSSVTLGSWEYWTRA